MSHLNINSKNLAGIILVGMAGITLASCSSSNSDTNLGGVTIPSNPIQITSSNVDQVVRQSNEAEQNTATAVDSAATSPSAGTPATGTQGTGTQSTGTQSTDTQSAMQLSLESIKQLNIDANNRKNAISPLATNDCPQGGSMTTPDDPNGIGDYIYKDCKYTNFVLNGKISIKGTLDPNGTGFDGSYAYDNLTISGTDTNAVVDGLININWLEDSIVTSVHYDIPTLTFVWNGDGVKIVDYVLDYYQNLDTSDRYLDFQYTINSTVLDGSIHAETTQRLNYLIGADYPYEGQVSWSGANGSNARLTVLSGGSGAPTDNVLIEVDSDGDGVYEYSKTLQWQNL